MAITTFPMIEKCTSIDRENDIVVTDLDGTLLRGRNSFAYFALVAFDVDGVLRLLFLLLASPIAGILYYFISESAGIQVIVFATFVGMKVFNIESAARNVLPKFYSEDLHPESWRVFSSCGKRCVLTATPRIMVEPFLKDYLGTDIVLGTEIETYKGRATGFVRPPGVLVGKNKADTLTSTFGDTQPEIGLGDRDTDIPFMTLCKEGYFVPSNLKVNAVSTKVLPKPVIFYDGRFIKKLTPLISLLVILWIPLGFLLACVRLSVMSFLPVPLQYYAFLATGIRLIINGIPPLHIKKSKGLLFVCCHKTILDNIFLSVALDRSVPVVTYSTSRFLNIFSPIKTITLTRDRAFDASMIKKLLKQRDLTIFPEGTTSRGQFLLRFSSLFAEITNEIVPVAIEAKMSMFHGTTTRGWKWMDPFFFLMNPRPTYEITFLNKLSYEFTCKSGKSSHEVASYVQKVIGETLSYECTTFTRKDKYMALDTIVKNP
ncbi:glycerol-3-phosphate acyltransferase RAM2-like [Solanum lycopersicum]|uniref:Glycerol-3-phosphate acyltransferase RAM2 n=1 Tax=Solanum lycopersicum TaxID=4081 RepID=A0A3Q7IMD3_SOLLC|nr:glycerol-3-phosphate 2-O-acyltransferase 6-like [Solanum lycopersicum]